MIKRTCHSGLPHLKPALLATTIAFIFSNHVLALGSPGECDTSISTLVDGCQISVDHGVTIATNGSVAVNSNTAIYISSNGANTLLDNNGSIIADSHSSTGIYAPTLNGSITNQGNISALASTANSAATAIGIHIGVLGSTGSIANQGTINATASALSDSVYALGMYIQNSVATDISNSGTISATGTSSNDNGHFVYGVYISNLNAGNTLTNEGSISAYSEGGLNLDSNHIYAIFSTGTGNIINKGFISGAIYTNGNYITVEGSTHEIVLQSLFSSSNYDSWIGGDADLSNTRISVKTTEDSSIRDGDIFYDVISTGGLLNINVEQLGALTDHLLLYNFNLAWNADNENTGNDNNLDIIVERQPINSAVEGSYSGIADTLENLFQSGNTCSPSNNSCEPVSSLIQRINQSGNKEQLRSLLASAMPALGGQTAFAINRSHDAINDAVLTRLTNNQSSGDSRSSDKTWAKIIGNSASREETVEALGYAMDNSGIMFGVDSDLDENTRIGMGLAVTSGNIEGKKIISSQTVEIENIQGLFYAGWNFPKNAFSNIQASYGGVSNILTINSEKAEYTTTIFSLSGSYGQNYNIDDRWTAQPIASLSYITVNENGYTLRLINVDEHSANTLEAGINGNFGYTVSDNSRFTLRAGLAYDLSGDTTVVDATFINGPAFSTETDHDTVSVKLGVGLDLAHTESTSFSMNYDLINRGEFNSNTVSAKVSHSF